MKFLRWLRFCFIGTKHKVYVGDQLITTVRVRPHKAILVNLQGFVIGYGLVRFDPPIHRTQNESIVINYRYTK